MIERLGSPKPTYAYNGSELDTGHASENELWVPDATIRGHHWGNPLLKEVFMRRIAPEVAASRLVDNYEFMEKNDPWENIDGYWADVLGASDLQDNSFVIALATYFRNLFLLQYNDIVQFDEEPDGICRSCVVGRHCGSVNYFSTVTSNGSTDSGTIMHLIQSLQGYKLGQDYRVGTGSKQVRDLVGGNLKFPMKGVMQEVKYNSLQVKAGVLRDMVNQQERDVALALLSQLTQPY